MRRRAFTLAELLVVLAVVVVLAGIVLPVVIQVKQQANKVQCLANFKSAHEAATLYLSDYDDRLPDRRDLKASLGYRPWVSWPPSDPRGEWASQTLKYRGTGEPSE